MAYSRNALNGRIVNILNGDSSSVSWVEPHPHTLLLASSGLETSIKLWAPTRTEQILLDGDLTRMCLLNRTLSRLECSRLRIPQTFVSIVPEETNGSNDSTPNNCFVQ
jgi:5-methylcytosine-specific restriction endonuclease McrA